MSAITLQGGPRDGETIEFPGGSEVIIPEVFSHRMEPGTFYSIFGGDVRFIYHHYDARGNYLGVRIRPVALRWPGFEPFPRWSRTVRKVRQLRDLRVRIVRAGDFE